MVEDSPDICIVKGSPERSEVGLVMARGGGVMLEKYDTSVPELDMNGKRSS